MGPVPPVRLNRMDPTTPAWDAERGRFYERPIPQDGPPAPLSPTAPDP